MYPNILFVPQPAAGEIMTWWSKGFTKCPPYATVLWFFLMMGLEESKQWLLQTEKMTQIILNSVPNNLSIQVLWKNVYFIELSAQI